MAYGYAGKILKLNLTTKEISRLDTAQYEEFGGGSGMGAAIFWDLAVAPGDWDLQDAFDPRNVISLMTGPMAATAITLTATRPKARAPPPCLNQARRLAK